MRTLKPIRQTGLKENMSELIAASYAKRTRIKYQRDLKKLREWLNGQKLMDEPCQNMSYISMLLANPPVTCISVTTTVNAVANVTSAACRVALISV